MDKLVYLVHQIITYITIIAFYNVLMDFMERYNNVYHVLKIVKHVLIAVYVLNVIINLMEDNKIIIYKMIFV